MGATETELQSIFIAVWLVHNVVDKRLKMKCFPSLCHLIFGMIENRSWHFC